jgi:hypothetical protein
MDLLRHYTYNLGWYRTFTPQGVLIEMGYEFILKRRFQTIHPITGVQTDYGWLRN